VQTSCTESFCRTAAEAAACGCPVVASRVGGLEALAVRDGRTGILIDLEGGHRWLNRLTAGDRAAFFTAILGLLTDSARRRRMGDAGAAYAARELDDRDTLAAERAVLDRLRIQAPSLATGTGAE
jgi:glycosyltransferase involved in cell wall biosynthesis